MRNYIISKLCDLILWMHDPSEGSPIKVYLPSPGGILIVSQEDDRMESIEISERIAEEAGYETISLAITAKPIIFIE